MTEKTAMWSKNIPSKGITPRELMSTADYDLTALIESELGAKVRAKKEMALIAIVGRNMVGKSGICARIFASLSAVGINIKMIAQPPDETNIIVGVDNNNYQKAIKALYDDFKSVDWI